MLVGLSMKKNILQAFAVTNSEIIYGVALILACFVKKQMKGVKVRIKISFEVKIVRRAIRKWHIMTN